MSLPIFVVAIILQVTGIWNDFLFGVVYTKPDTYPMTVQLNNIVNSVQGVKEYNVNMAATHPDRPRAADRLFRLRQAVRARHRRRRGEGVSAMAANGTSVSVKDLTLNFGNVSVLKDLNLDVDRRRVPRAARAFGLRKVDAAQLHRRPARRRRTGRSSSRARTSPGRSPRTAASAWCSSPMRSIRR